MLRLFFKFKRRLFGELCHAAVKALIRIEICIFAKIFLANLVCSLYQMEGLISNWAQHCQGKVNMSGS